MVEAEVEEENKVGEDEVEDKNEDDEVGERVSCNNRVVGLKR